MDDRVEEQPGAHRVGRKEEVVAVRESRRDVFMEEVVGDGFYACAGICSADIARRQSDFVGAEPVRKLARKPGRRTCVGASRRDEARKVSEIRPVGIGEDEVSNAEPPEQLGQNGSGSTETDNPDPGTP